MTAAPSIFVIGAAKSGTNSLFDSLAALPGIAACKVKEPGYYASDLGRSRRVADRNAYLRLFGSGRRLDGSVWYLLSEVAVAEIERRELNAQYIVCLRRQADMAYSLYGQFRRNLMEDSGSFEQAWNLQDSRRLGKNTPAYCPHHPFLQYRQVCSVGEQVQRLLQRVDRSRVLFVEMREMKQSWSEVSRSVVEFLGLEAETTLAPSHSNVARELRIDPYKYLLRNGAHANSVLRAKLVVNRIGFRPASVFRRILTREASTGADLATLRFLEAIQTNDFAEDTRTLRARTGLALEDF